MTPDIMKALNAVVLEQLRLLRINHTHSEVGERHLKTCTKYNQLEIFAADTVVTFMSSPDYRNVYDLADPGMLDRLAADAFREMLHHCIKIKLKRENDIRIIRSGAGFAVTRSSYSCRDGQLINRNKVACTVERVGDDLVMDGTQYPLSGDGSEHSLTKLFSVIYSTLAVFRAREKVLEQRARAAVVARRHHA